MEAGKELLIVLRAVAAVKENFQSDYIVNFVEGRATDDIVSYHHEQLEEFGEGEDEDRKLWNPVIRQAIISGYLKKDIESYGVLKLTSAGRKFMKHPGEFQIVLDNEFDYDYAEEEPAGSGALDPELFGLLKDLRKKTAQKLSLPTYVIFQDVSLEQMATMYPITLEEMQNIQGVGMGKARRYGKPFCELIASYCKENEIERPEELRVRTVAKASMVKVKIIQNIDKKIALDDIALALGLDFDEMLSEVEAIVYSGTKLNIDYFLEEVMDDEHVDDIYDYFRESETDDLEVAQEELGGTYSDEEIRLVRIKFISEMGN